MLYFCFCYLVSLVCLMSLIEESCHLSIYLITLHSRWVQEYTTAVKVKNTSMNIVSTMMDKYTLRENLPSRTKSVSTRLILVLIKRVLLRLRYIYVCVASLYLWDFLSMINKKWKMHIGEPTAQFKLRRQTLFKYQAIYSVLLLFKS